MKRATLYAALGVALALGTSGATAALQQVSGLVTNLRIEGAVYGFIGYNGEMPGTPACGSRVWVDMRTAEGRATYATALAALTAKLPVFIRAYDESTRVYGACNLYDIYVTAQ